MQCKSPIESFPCLVAPSKSNKSFECEHNIEHVVNGNSKTYTKHPHLFCVSKCVDVCVSLFFFANTSLSGETEHDGATPKMSMENFSLFLCVYSIYRIHQYIGDVSVNEMENGMSRYRLVQLQICTQTPARNKMNFTF